MAEVVRTQGVRQFFFADSVFNMPQQHTLDLCRAIARRGLDVRWMAYTNSARFDDEMARCMVEAGCLGIEFGLDAVTDKMLHNWRKPFRQKDVRRSLAACRDAGLPAAVHLLFGGPGETVADVRESQAFLDDCAPVDAVFASARRPHLRRRADRPHGTAGRRDRRAHRSLLPDVVRVARPRDRPDAHARRHRAPARSLDDGDGLDEHARPRDPDDHEPLRGAAAVAEHPGVRAADEEPPCRLARLRLVRARVVVGECGAGCDLGGQALAARTPTSRLIGG
jgi:hypothetical protein